MFQDSERPSAQPEHLDHLVVGAGISGIGVAAHLRRAFPDRSFAVLEGRDRLGGTWDVFRYPGIRSDSDVATFGYEFKPWPGDEIIATGEKIRSYLHDAARENGLLPHIRYRHRVERAAWSSEEQLWRVSAVRHTEEGEVRVELTCRWLLGTSGFYDVEEGHQPELPGEASFEGRIVHPQRWPDDLDHAGKRVVVIGSGATAVTLVPAMAETAERVVMLQRSPSYVLSVPRTDPPVALVRRLFGEDPAHRFARWKNIPAQLLIYRGARRLPRLFEGLIRRQQRRHLGEDYDLGHFTPGYAPWDQRLCMVPDGDLYAAVASGDAEVVTDEIERVTPGGLLLRSGRELEADLIVSATGLKLRPFGGIELTVDGEAVRLPETAAYKTMMLAGVPNFAYVMGYINASWTLKVDLVGRWLVRLLRYMRARGAEVCVAEPDDDLELEPLITELNSGYVERGVDLFPRRGDRGPWRVSMDYTAERREFLEEPIEDGVLTFEPAREGAVEAGRTIAA